MIARIDGNHSDIVKALRSVGATVQSLASVGSGCPDLLVGINGKNYLIEVKNGELSPSRQRLTADEAIWHNEWKGKVSIATDVKEAMAAIGAQMQ